AAEGGDVTIVSNVISAALAHPAVPSDPDPVSLVSFLSGADAGRPLATAFRAVKAVPEGHTLVLGGRRAASLHRHWSIPEPETLTARPAEIVEGYRAVLAAAVADRQADRTAIFLSGGIDSTSIAAAADRGRRLRAFTVEYRRFGRCGELEYARRAA